nr:hypothetical protein [Chitinophagaceae bacterium]
MKRRILLLLIVFMALTAIIPMAIEYQFNQLNTGRPNRLSNEQWIHRGLYNGITVFENTVAAFDSAKDMGLKGIELDIFYIDSINDFVVTHDLPNPYGLPPLLLSDVISRYDSSYYYWFDLKNLSTENQEKITARFQDITPAHVKTKVYIESGAAKPLGFLAKSGFNTIYWIQYNRTHFIKSFLKKIWIKWDCIRYKFDGVSMGMTLADEDFFESFETIPKFIFHIYTPELFLQVKNRSNIAVYLMDYLPTE